MFISQTVIPLLPRGPSNSVVGEQPCLRVTPM
jgi:hypothetical protein